MKNVINENIKNVEEEEIEIGSIQFILGFFKFLYERIIKPG